MPRLPRKPVTLTAPQRIQSAREQARTFREMADRMNPEARARLLEKAAQWTEVARVESEQLERAGDGTLEKPGPKA